MTQFGTIDLSQGTIQELFWSQARELTARTALCRKDKERRCPVWH